MKIFTKAMLVLALTFLGCSQVYAVNKKGCVAGAGAGKASKISVYAKGHCGNRRGSVVKGKGHKKSYLTLRYCPTCHHSMAGCETSAAACIAAYRANAERYINSATGRAAIARARAEINAGPCRSGCSAAVIARMIQDQNRFGESSLTAWGTRYHEDGIYQGMGPGRILPVLAYALPYTKARIMAIAYGQITPREPTSASSGAGGVTPNNVPETTATRPRMRSSSRGRLQQQIQRCKAMSSADKRNACLKRIK
ncbi:MAG: hypothetical protein K0U29_04290 [Gammaproteobacteria bacterium]|nr:hypothetical protein [Gammaproteobacteria bacterium]